MMSDPAIFLLNARPFYTEALLFLVFLAISALPGFGTGFAAQWVRGPRPLPWATAVFAAMVGAYLWPWQMADKLPPWFSGILAAVVFGVAFHFGAVWRRRTGGGEADAP